MYCENGVCYLSTYEPCKNFIACKNKIAFNEETKNGLCNDCYHIFGEWRKRHRSDVKLKNICGTCPMCNEEKQTILYRMDCDHSICVDCFRKIYFGLEIKKPVLKFGNSSEDYKLNLEKWNRINELYKDNIIKMECNECKSNE
jgi:hypothetical protein